MIPDPALLQSNEKPYRGCFSRNIQKIGTAVMKRCFLTWIHLIYYNSIAKFNLKIFFWRLNPQAPVAQKIAHEVKEATFFKSDLTDPPQIFYAHLLENIDLSTSRSPFSVSFYIKIMFWVGGFYSLFERMRLKRKKRCLFILTNLYSHHFI